MMIQKYDLSFRKNNEIDAREVYLVDETGLILIGFRDALKKSEEAALDLVQVGEKQDIPICKIFDFSSFIYKKVKTLKQNKKAEAVNKVKTVRFSVFTDIGDFDRKIDQIIKFLSADMRVAVFVKPIRGKNVRAQKQEAPQFQERVISALKMKSRANLDITQGKNPLYFYVLVRK